MFKLILNLIQTIGRVIRSAKEQEVVEKKVSNLLDNNRTLGLTYTETHNDNVTIYSDDLVVEEDKVEEDKEEDTFGLDDTVKVNLDADVPKRYRGRNGIVKFIDSERMELGLDIHDRISLLTISMFDVVLIEKAVNIEDDNSIWEDEEDDFFDDDDE